MSVHLQFRFEGCAQVTQRRLAELQIRSELLEARIAFAGRTLCEASRRCKMFSSGSAKTASLIAGMIFASVIAHMNSAPCRA